MSVLALSGLGLAAAPAGAIPLSRVSDFAGTGQPIAATEGPAHASGLNVPVDLALDSSHNLYVADQFNNRVEKITPAGQLSFFAGTGDPGASTEGDALMSDLNAPSGVAVGPDGSVYISDSGNHRVVKVDGQGDLSFVAGNGTSGGPTEGTATSVMLMDPRGLALDQAGNLYIADTGAKKVLKVDTSGNLTFFAGNGSAGSPTNGTATSVAIGAPVDVAVDSAGVPYVSVPVAGKVFKVTSGQLTVFAGGGAGACDTLTDQAVAVGAALCAPTGLSIADDEVWIAAAGNHRIVRLGTGDTDLTFAAGDGTDGSSFGTPATAQQIGQVSAVVMGSDNVGYISDSMHQNTISRFSLNGENVPGIPQNIAGTPGNQSAQVSWGAPASNGGAPVTGYKVRLEPTTIGAGQPVTVSVDGNTTSTTVGSLTNGTTYVIKVLAMNVIGEGIYGQGTQNVTPAAPPTTPGLPQNVQLVPGDQQLTVTFDIPASDGNSAILRYEYTWDGGTTVNTLTTTGTDTKSATFTGLTNGTAYTIQLRAVNAIGDGQWTTGVSATPATLPGAPTGVSAEAGDTTATVMWTPPADNGGAAVTGYTITAVPTAGPTVTEDVPAGSSGTIHGLVNDVAYAVTVAATNAAGTGPASSPAVTVTPVNLAASVTAAHLAPQVHVGAPSTSLNLQVTIDKPRPQVTVLFGSLVKSQLIASRVLTRESAGTEFSGAMIFHDDDVPAWGSGAWAVTPGEPGNTELVPTDIRLHSLLGLKLTRSGEWLTVSGSARAYHSVLDVYKPWNNKAIMVQRWTAEGWSTVRTVPTDKYGNISTRFRIPWKAGFRLTMEDAPKIWGATSLSASL